MDKVIIDRELCKGCELCIRFCPRKLIAVSRTLNWRGCYPVEFIDPKEECVNCALCALICPDTAIEVYK